ncbi:hypothetical protein [Tomitella fengzijianii]|uniref:hypothetical protein n=1 Tax=Tomitella fengzijianii TaxID=2597660 RepID=UPI0018EEEAD0
MSRRKHRRGAPRPAAPLRVDPLARVEPGPGGADFHVRQIPAARAAKRYRCPGCDHEIAPSVAHIVAWPEDAFGGADERRHWHSGCWRSRRTRGVTRRWS